MPGYWRKINAAIRHALEGVTLADLGSPVPDFLAAFPLNPSSEDALKQKTGHDNI
jgi:hypothetical protein